MDDVRGLQTKFIGTIFGIVLVYFIITSVIPFLSGWLSSAGQSSAELRRLAKREEENKQERRRLQEELERVEKEAFLKKKYRADGKQNSRASSTPQFKFPEKPEGGSEEVKEEKVIGSEPKETLKGKVAAPAAGASSATKPSWTTPRTSAPTSSNASTHPNQNNGPIANPWASFTMPSPAAASGPASSNAAGTSFSREREEQDREYRESLRADQAKQRRKQEEMEQKQEKEDIASTLRDSVTSLVPTVPRAGPDTVVISFRLMGFGLPKDSVRFSRRFRSLETVEDVLNFWKGHSLVDSEDMHRVEICSTYPVQVLCTTNRLSAYDKEVMIVRRNENISLNI